MDNELLCNFKKCRKRLNSFAWVTSCSHIFCDEDGTREFNKAYICPACETNLSGKFDIIRIDLQPSEQYKSMVLAGQKPETIIEVCSRAITFWTYQSHQERTYQEFIANKSKEKNIQMEQYYEQILTRTQSELNTLKLKVIGTKKEFDILKKRYSEVSEKLVDKSRQYQKLQMLYDALRRKCISPSSFDVEQRECTPLRRRNEFDFRNPTVSDLHRLHTSRPGRDRDARCTAIQSPAEREFVMQPVSTPVMAFTSSSAEHRASSNIQNKFHLSLVTPQGNQH